MTDAIRLDAWLDAPDQCRPCGGPIVAKTKLGMIRDYVCFAVAMVWPDRFFMSRPHAAILPYAGTHAFTCTCWPKIADAIVDRSPQGGNAVPSRSDESAAIAQPLSGASHEHR